MSQKSPRRLERTRYAIEVNTPEGPEPTVEHVVDVTHGDRMRAELEGPKNGLKDLRATPMNYSTLWCWAALVRLGLYTGSYQQFKQTDLYDLSPLNEEAEPADPTTADPSA